MIKIAMTYDLITDDDIATGDVTDNGFAEPGGWTYSIVDETFNVRAHEIGREAAIAERRPNPEEFETATDVARFLSKYGPLEFLGGSWRQVMGSDDLGKPNYSFHPEGLADEQYYGINLTLGIQDNHRRLPKCAQIFYGEWWRVTDEAGAVCFVDCDDVSEKPDATELEPYCPRALSYPHAWSKVEGYGCKVPQSSEWSYFETFAQAQQWATQNA